MRLPAISMNVCGSEDLGFDVESVALENLAAEHLHVKILRDNDVVNRHDEMI